MIPRLLHRIVLPPLDPDGPIAAYWDGFERLHPEWTLRTWTEPTSHEFPETHHLFEWCGSPAQVADVMRVELLWRLGGFYVDADCEPHRPLDPLCDLAFVIGRNGQEYGTGVIGCERGHPAIRAYLDAILDVSRDDLRSYPPNVSTGPFLARRVLGGRADVTVLPSDAFYPEPWTETMERRRKPASSWATERTFVVHRWHESWVPPLTPYGKARRIARRYVAQPWRKAKRWFAARRP